MTADELRTFLKQIHAKFEEKTVPHGIQFRCPGGEIFAVYASGKIAYQGAVSSKLAKAVKAFEESRSGTEFVPVDGGVEPGKPVFIVHGHDTAARDSLELMLRRMGLSPIILQNLPASGDTIIEKLERYLGEHDSSVGFACVLLTPDDEGNRVGRTDEKKYRARQNVVLELGMVLGRLGRRRVAILHKGSVELPSDISGLLYIPFTERVEEAKTKLFQELRQAGYNPKSEAL